MNRKEFIQNCGFACLGAAIGGIASCSTGLQIISGKIVDDDLVVPVSDFEIKHRAAGFKKYLVVEHEILRYPVCIYRFAENDYTAMFMRCTHQGATLQVFGDVLQCPAHGSEFNNRGIMQNGPASAHLRTFSVTIENDQLKISLKAI